MMSNFEKRVRQARRQSMRKWARGLRYCADVGVIFTGAMGLWMVACVVLS